MTAFIAQTLKTPDGPFTLIADASGAVVGAAWTDDVAGLATRAGLDYKDVGTGVCAASDAVRAYYAGDVDAPAAVPVSQHGTTFQTAVWGALRHIPVGAVSRYGELAAALGSPGASRAVGAACGRNAVALFVPCHRVVGASGALTGFAWGVDVKRSLLTREGVTL